MTSILSTTNRSAAHDLLVCGDTDGYLRLFRFYYTAYNAIQRSLLFFHFQISMFKSESRIQWTKSLQRSNNVCKIPFQWPQCCNSWRNWCRFNVMGIDGGIAKSLLRLLASNNGRFWWIWRVRWWLWIRHSVSGA